MSVSHSGMLRVLARIQGKPAAKNKGSCSGVSIGSSESTARTSCTAAWHSTHLRSSSSWSSWMQARVRVFTRRSRPPWCAAAGRECTAQHNQEQ